MDMENCRLGRNGNAVAMPKYRSHKEVHALKIASIAPNPEVSGTMDENHAATFTPVDERFEPIHLSAEYMEKHSPEAGGYYVVYADGYLSFSPAEAFESGYKLIS